MCIYFTNRWLMNEFKKVNEGMIVSIRWSIDTYFESFKVIRTPKTEKNINAKRMQVPLMKA